MTAGYDVANRVALGVSFLDAEVPGWPWRISLPELNLESLCNCVVGQIFGQWSEGAQTARETGWIPSVETEMEEQWGVASGFDTSSGSPLEWDQLQAEWERVINERRRAGA